MVILPCTSPARIVLLMSHSMKHSLQTLEKIVRFDTVFAKVK